MNILNYIEKGGRKRDNGKTRISHNEKSEVQARETPAHGSTGFVLSGLKLP